MTNWQAAKKLFPDYTQMSHGDFTHLALNQWLGIPSTQIAISLPLDSPDAQEILGAIYRVDDRKSCELLASVENVPGVVMEFGVSRGDALSVLLDAMDRSGKPRTVYGLDSFEGLPQETEHDLDCWKKGMYAANMEETAKRLKQESRPHLHLIKGWFNESFKLPELQAIKQIAYCRVDGDLYESAVDCLDYLTHRLSDKSILVFDEWTFDMTKGETKAFAEWYPRVQNLYSFEFLHFMLHGRMYLRVHKIY